MDSSPRAKVPENFAFPLRGASPPLGTTRYRSGSRHRSDANRAKSVSQEWTSPWYSMA